MLGSTSIPTHRLQLRALVVVLVLLAPMVVRPTSLVPPYHEFHVRGQLVSSGGSSTRNYTVGIAVQKEYPPDGYFLLREGGVPLAITTDTGAFVLSSRVYGPPDSLCIAVLMPGDELIVGDPFARVSVQPTEMSAPYSVPADGCCESATEGTRVVGYHYVYPDQIVTIP